MPDAEQIARAYVTVARAARNLVDSPADKDAKLALRYAVEELDVLLLVDAESRIGAVFAEMGS